MTTPWFVLQGEIDQVCDPAATRAYVARVPGGRLKSLPDVGHGFSVPRRWDSAFVDAWRALAAPREAPPPSLPAVADLPLVEVPATPGRRDERLAVLVSGDGGWAEFDRDLAAALAARGIPVVGWSSLRYFWSPRTPEQAAADLDRVLRHYLQAWGRERVLLAGYSFGADVLPFLVRRLPDELRSRVDGLGLIGLSTEAAFEFHVASWFGGGGEPRWPTVPEVKRSGGMRVVCVRGAAERASACDALQGVTGVSVVRLPGGHHFGGEAERLADAIVGGGGR
jgi:type IV secretory pathway VirJ component